MWFNEYKNRVTNEGEIPLTPIMGLFGGMRYVIAVVLVTSRHVSSRHVTISLYLTQSSLTLLSSVVYNVAVTIFSIARVVFQH